MNTRTVVMACVVALVGCGGGGKGADSPGTCPEGTMLKGSDCVPDESSSSASNSESSGGGGSKAADDSSGSSGSASTTSSAGSTANADSSAAPAAGDKAPYDKELVGVELKRAARQVKGNCGSATDENGKAVGPWGATKATVVLGRNGHVRDVTVPAPFDGKPVGICIVHAFQKVQFPPYSASSDVSLDWDIEVTEPKH